MNTSRKWKQNSRRSMMTSSLSWTRTSSHQPDGLLEPKVIQFEQVDFEQVAEKRPACDVAKNDTNLVKQSVVSKNT